jgi:hypothetical protein
VYKINTRIQFAYGNGIIAIGYFITAHYFTAYIAYLNCGLSGCVTRFNTQLVYSRVKIDMQCNVISVDVLLSNTANGLKEEMFALVML